jgi:hypothetical protein
MGALPTCCYGGFCEFTEQFDIIDDLMLSAAFVELG